MDSTHPTPLPVTQDISPKSGNSQAFGICCLRWRPLLYRKARKTELNFKSVDNFELLTARIQDGGQKFGRMHDENHVWPKMEGRQVSMDGSGTEEIWVKTGT